MANYATNIFYARTENKADLDKIEAFLDDTFDGFVNRHSDSVDAEFTSRWVYPEEEIDRLIASLEAKDKTYGEFYQFNLSSCIRQQNSLTAQFVSFSFSNLANIFYTPPIFTIINLCLL